LKGKLGKRVMQELVVDGIKISVEKKKIKNVYIRVTPPIGQVKITAPLSVSEDAICKFVSFRSRWIHKHQQRFLQQPVSAKVKYLNGENLLLWGQSYPLEVVCSGRNAVTFADQKIVLQVNNASTQQCEAVINEWYRETLKAAIPLVLAKCERIVGVKAGESRIKNMRTRWGTCNIQERRIWVNLQLVKKTPEGLEYVITHELVHLLEKGHNDKFKAYMDSFYPDWRRVKAGLNNISP
jgi:hypothetical protein